MLQTCTFHFGRLPLPEGFGDVEAEKGCPYSYCSGAVQPGDEGRKVRLLFAFARSSVDLKVIRS